LLAEVVDRGGLLYAWTVNDRGAIQSLRRLGVHGITTADPRLFEPDPRGGDDRRPRPAAYDFS